MADLSSMSQDATEFTTTVTESDLATWHKVLSEQSVQDTMTKYRLSKYGFLPESCDTVLPDNFKFFEYCISMISETKSFGDQFREIVNELPEYDSVMHQVNMLSYAQQANLFSILTIIINRYVWCQGIEDAKNYNRIPAILSVPLYQLSELLGVVPTLSHGSIDLWNWKLINPLNPFDLDNIDILHTMTGTESEEWFYKIMICIEGKAGDVVRIAHQIKQYYSVPEKLVSILKIINLRLQESVQIINRMYEHCNPDVFFDKIRIYLSGSLNDNLPQGIIFDLQPLGLSTKTYLLHGGSAAQSSLIQMYDILFGIQHSGHGKEFLDKMRQYMPGSHREYAEELAKKISIKRFIELSFDNNMQSNIEQINYSLKYIYEQCVKNITNLREAHIRIVHKYVILMIEDRNKADLLTNAHGTKGSGGTNPIVFCKQIIDDSKRAIQLKNQCIKPDIKLNELIDRPGYTKQKICKSYVLFSIVISILAIICYSIIKY